MHIVLWARLALEHLMSAVGRLKAHRMGLQPAKFAPWSPMPLEEKAGFSGSLPETWRGSNQPMVSLRTVGGSCSGHTVLD
jgi:hypothetical protein